MKRIAREQSQIVAGGWLEDGDVGGGDDFRGLDDVVKAALSRFEFDFVADTNVAQGAEKSVAVRGQSNVALFTRQSGIGKVADGAVQSGG